MLSYDILIHVFSWMTMPDIFNIRHVSKKFMLASTKAKLAQMNILTLNTVKSMFKLKNHPLFIIMYDKYYSIEVPHFTKVDTNNKYHNNPTECITTSNIVLDKKITEAEYNNITGEYIDDFLYHNRHMLQKISFSKEYLSFYSSNYIDIYLPFQHLTSSEVKDVTNIINSDINYYEWMLVCYIYIQDRSSTDWDDNSGDIEITRIIKVYTNMTTHTSIAVTTNMESNSYFYPIKRIVKIKHKYVMYPEYVISRLRRNYLENRSMTINLYKNYFGN